MTDRSEPTASDSSSTEPSPGSGAVSGLDAPEDDAMAPEREDRAEPAGADVRLGAAHDDGEAAPESDPSPPPSAPVRPRADAATEERHGRPPTFVFFGVVAGLSLLADVASKAWAQLVLSHRTVAEPGIVLIDRHLTLTLAYNRGGAWGILQDASEAIRRPFFLLVSVAAILFIVSLYSRLQPMQRALTWGLPLVLGGALGNLTDRVVRNSVIDFIDFRAAWIGQMNQLIAERLSPGWSITEHWPTFNVADVSICIGVGLMAVDMLFSRRGPAPERGAPARPASVRASAPPKAGPAADGRESLATETSAPPPAAS